MDDDACGKTVGLLDHVQRKLARLFGVRTRSGDGGVQQPRAPTRNTLAAVLERNRQCALALACGLHQRCGAASVLRCCAQHVVRAIARRALTRDFVVADLDHGRHRVYDPVAAAWLDCGDDAGCVIMVGDSMPAVCGVGAKVFVCSCTVFVSEAWECDLHTDTWHRLPTMPCVRAGACATACGDTGIVLVSGGVCAKEGALCTCDFFNTTTQEWSPAPPLIKPRLNHVGCALPGGGILIAGGAGGVGGNLRSDNSIQVYDPQAHEWRIAHPMHKARNHPVLWFDPRDGLTHVLGGDSDRTWESFNGTTWTMHTPVETVRVFGSCVADGRLLATIFMAGGHHDLAEFDPRTGRWARLTGMPRYSLVISSVTLLW
eukprot:TRINITY_DN692_c0_g1_i1.p1 TRINITY_DN692_c0_g1~~TRINITY_DN692_c0_g1_i1.p1  ORF type:complete len:373 (-),score=67.64 TRINITY_DN692_c0_g1_i1:527-1645(-)